VWLVQKSAGPANVKASEPYDRTGQTIDSASSYKIRLAKKRCKQQGAAADVAVKGQCESQTGGHSPSVKIPGDEERRDHQVLAPAPKANENSRHNSR